MKLQELWFNNYARVLEIECKEKYLYSIDLYAECREAVRGDSIKIDDLNVIYGCRDKLSLSTGRVVEYCIVYVETRESIQAVNARLWSSERLGKNEIEEAREKIRGKLENSDCKVIV